MKLRFMGIQSAALATIVSISAVGIGSAGAQQTETKGQKSQEPPKVVNIFAEKAKREKARQQQTELEQKQVKKLASLPEMNLPPASGSFQAVPKAGTQPQPLAALNKKTDSLLPPASLSGSAQISMTPVPGTLAPSVNPLQQSLPSSAKKMTIEVTDPKNSTALNQKPELTKVPSREESVAGLSPKAKVKEPATFTESPAPIVFGVGIEKKKAESVTSPVVNSQISLSSNSVSISPLKPAEVQQEKPGPLGKLAPKSDDEKEEERIRRLNREVDRKHIGGSKVSSQIKRPRQRPATKPLFESNVRQEYVGPRTIGNGVRVIGPSISSFPYSPQVAATNQSTVHFMHSPAVPSGRLTAAPTFRMNPNELRQRKILLRTNPPIIRLQVRPTRVNQSMPTRLNPKQFIR